MQEQGFINRPIADILASLGHLDEVIITDAGFPIPLGVRSVDLAWAVNQPPRVPELIAEILKVFSVEQVVMAEELERVNPSRFRAIKALFDAAVAVQTIPHTELKQRSRAVKGIIRTGDFTGYSNVMLVSGGGNRWYCEAEG